MFSFLVQVWKRKLCVVYVLSFSNLCKLLYMSRFRFFFIFFQIYTNGTDQFQNLNKNNTENEQLIYYWKTIIDSCLLKLTHSRNCSSALKQVIKETTNKFIRFSIQIYVEMCVGLILFMLMQTIPCNCISFELVYNFSNGEKAFN